MNRLFTKTIICFLIWTLFVGIVSAETANADLPSASAITSFCEKYTGNNFIDTVKTKSVAENPTWKWDVIEGCGNKLIAFYFHANNERGYGSVYYNNTGDVVIPDCSCNYELLKSYKGIGSGNNTVKDTNKVKSSHTLDDLKNIMNAYSGNIDCQSMSCAQQVADYLTENGYECGVTTRTFNKLNSVSKTRYCIDVVVEVNGLKQVLSIVLGK